MSFIYTIGGFSFMYNIVALITFISILPFFSIEFKDEQNISLSDKKQQGEEKLKSKNIESSNKAIEAQENFFSTISKFDVFILAFSQFSNKFCRVFSAPILTKHLINKFDISIETSSQVQSLSFISYIITFKKFNCLMEKLGAKMLIVIGIFFNILYVVTLGPILILPQ